MEPQHKPNSWLLYFKFSARSTGWLAWATLKLLLNSCHILLWYIWSAGILPLHTEIISSNWWSKNKCCSSLEVDCWNEDEKHAAQQSPIQFSWTHERKNCFAAEQPFWSQLTQLHDCAIGEHSSSCIWKFRTSSFKYYVNHTNTIHYSRNLDVRNWVHLFEL
jgi:hypothetical protein